MAQMMFYKILQAPGSNFRKAEKSLPCNEMGLITTKLWFSCRQVIRYGCVVKNFASNYFAYMLKDADQLAYSLKWSCEEDLM